jgi:hypothetical protein
MAISDSQKVDYLWKKIGYSATKSDNVKQGFEEAIPSPLQIRGDKVMTDSGSIPATIPGANTSILTVYTTSLPYECAVDGTTATPNRTWKTGLTDWISPEFGSTYQVKVWVNLASSAGNASTAGTSLSAGGSGNNDEWFFDYQAGLLHFIGTNLPNGVSFTGKSVYISGARYTGGFGVSAPGGGGSVGNLTISNVTISANSSAVSSSANIIFSTTGTGAVQFTGNAIGLPSGNILQRPTTVNAGYLRFNTEFETIEVWDGAEWVQTSGGVITSDVLNGDGSTAQFALSANTTTTGVLVSINGTIQKPSTAYTVSNNSITFTEIPALGDSIEVRKLSGGTISVNYGNADVAAFLTTYPGLYSNVQALALITTNGLTNYSNVNVASYVTTNGLTNYSNVNASALITTNGLTNYSNVNVASYLAGNITVGNITSTGNISTTGYFLGNASLLSGIIPVSAGGTGRNSSGTKGDIQFASNTGGALTSTLLLTYDIDQGFLGIGSGGLTNDKVHALSLDSVAVNFRAQNANSLAKFGIDSTGNLQIYAHTGKGQIFYTNGGVEQMRITSTGNVVIAGNIAGKTNGFTLGYLEMPQVASGNVTLALTDSGKHFYNTTASPQTITIPTFANVAFGNGTVVSIANQSTSNISVALQSGVILYLAGNATSASRTITSYGVATLLKVNTNTWFINGSGVA